MRILLAIAALSLGGCAYVPWHPFGTPLTAEKKAAQRVEHAESLAGSALVESVHKTNLAIDAAIAGKPNALDVAREHGRTAETLADQLYGSPTVIDEAKWRDLVSRQTALDEKVRALANVESAKRTQQIARLSGDLDDKTKALEASEQKALRFAAEKAAIADRFLKVCWLVGAIVGVFILARVLAFAAQFYPGLAGTSQIVNRTVAKVLHPSVRK